MAKKKVLTVWKVLSILGSIGFFLTNMILLLVVIGVLVVVFAPGDADFITGNVAVIPVHGVITAAGDDGFGGRGASSSDIVRLIQKADDSSAIDVILIEVNSPGGSPVASSEIVEAIKKNGKADRVRHQGSRRVRRVLGGECCRYSVRKPFVHHRIDWCDWLVSRD